MRAGSRVERRAGSVPPCRATVAPAAAYQQRPQRPAAPHLVVPQHAAVQHKEAVPPAGGEVDVLEQHAHHHLRTSNPHGLHIGSKHGKGRAAVAALSATGGPPRALRFPRLSPPRAPAAAWPAGRWRARAARCLHWWRGSGWPRWGCAPGRGCPGSRTCAQRRRCNVAGAPPLGPPTVRTLWRRRLGGTHQSLMSLKEMLSLSRPRGLGPCLSPLKLLMVGPSLVGLGGGGRYVSILAAVDCRHQLAWAISGTRPRSVAFLDNPGSRAEAAARRGLPDGIARRSNQAVEPRRPET